MYASLSLDYDRAHYNVCKPFARFSLTGRTIMYASLSLGRTIMYASLSLDCDRAHYNVCKQIMTGRTIMQAFR